MKKTVFLTGATGNMGYATFKELYKRRHMYNLVLLVLPYEKEKAEKLFGEYLGESLKIVFGDLTVYEDVLECVTGADYILHVGGMVSPAADYYPKNGSLIR